MVPDWSVAIASPTPKVTSMNGVTIEAQMSLDDLPQMDAVIVGSGSRTREYAADPGFLATLRLDPQRQLVGSQCSGALLLARLGLLDQQPLHAPDIAHDGTGRETRGPLLQMPVIGIDGSG